MKPTNSSGGKWCSYFSRAIFADLTGGRVADRRVVGIAVRPRGVDGSSRLRRVGTGREPLDEIGIGDVGSAERDHIDEPIGDQAIASLGGHIDVSDQRAAKGWGEMAKHAVAHQRLKGRAGEVCGIAHQQ
jgi:hypothetical protein